MGSSELGRYIAGRELLTPDRSSTYFPTLCAGVFCVDCLPRLHLYKAPRRSRQILPEPEPNRLEPYILASDDVIRWMNGMEVNEPLQIYTKISLLVRELGLGILGVQSLEARGQTNRTKPKNVQLYHY